jgi:hypothetical protein
MNPRPDDVPNLPAFEAVDLANPLPSSSQFIAQTTGFFMPPLLGFFTAVVSAVILWKIIQIFYR